MSFDDDLKALERRVELDRQRLPIEEAARKAQASGDLALAARLWTQCLELIRRGGDDFSRWYVEGQLADVLINSGKSKEARSLLEESLRAGNDLPFARSLLMNIYMEERAFAAAFRVQYDAWQKASKLARRNGMPPIDPTTQIVGFAKWWKQTESEEPIILAEKWAKDARAPAASFAVRHERAQFLEKQGSEDAALELYLELIRLGSKHGASYTRAMTLLDRAKRTDESLALARAIPELGLSASLEEQARKRIARGVAKAEKKGRASRAPKPPKALVPAFSIRSGASALQWIGQTDVKGGISSIDATPGGVYAIGGAEPALWWIAAGTTEATRLRSVSKRSQLCRSLGAALVTDEGTVKEGRAHVEVLGQDWRTIAEAHLPGVTSQVAPTTWGIALGCRAGGLYALGWDGAMRWRFDVPELAEPSSFGRACPYFVSAAAGGTVVCSSYANVYALDDRGQVVWTWKLPPRREPVLVQGASVSAVHATRDGGAWIASQDGGVFRVDGGGKLTWSTNVAANASQLVLDHDDRLVGIGHSSGIMLIAPGGAFTTAYDSKRWPRVVRSEDGSSYLITEGKVLIILDGAGRARTVVEFSRTITDAAFSARHITIAAGKLVVFDPVEVSRA